MKPPHDFQESLELSHAYADAGWWEDVYRQAFGNEYVGMLDMRDDGVMQRMGVDRWIALRSREPLAVDEKVRTIDREDIVLELWSNWQRCTASPPLKFDGWAVKPQRCDFIAYAFAPSSRCYLLPQETLRKAVSENWRAWRTKSGWGPDVRQRFDRGGFVRGTGGFGWVVAQNRGYTTVSMVVPIPTLMRAVTNAMLVRWDQLELL